MKDLKAKTAPKLRFRGFSDEWQVKKLSRVSDVRDGTHESPKYVDKGYPLITSKNLLKNGSLDLNNVSYLKEKDFNDINRRSGVEIGDILFGMIGTIGNPVRIKSKNFAIKNVALIKENGELKNEFLIHYLDGPFITRQFHTGNSGGTQKFLALGVIRNLDIVMPASEVEQEKIARFLGVVDDKISGLESKKKLLEKYKKGAMQAIFSQKIRFRDESGNDYPAWQENELGDLLDYEQPTRYIVESTEYSNENKIPVLTAGKSFILGYTKENTGIYDEKLPVIIFDDFTTASKFVNFPFKVKSSAIKILKAKQGVNIKIAYELLRRMNFVATDHKRYWIGEFQDFDVSLPYEQEQNKIANFLTIIDEKIEAEERKLEQAKQFKKALLQQMFV